MGSYKETCMLSQLPISAGDKVVGFILKTNHNTVPRHINRSTMLYAPSSFAIRGTYDDYGGLVDIIDESFHITYLFASFLDKAPSPLIADFTLPNLIESITKESIDEYTFVLIHASIYDQMVEHYATRNVPYETNITKKLEGDLEDILASKVLKYEPDNQLIRLDIPSKETNQIYDILNYHDTVFVHLHRVICQLFCVDKMVVFKEPIKDLYFFNDILFLTRKQWAPQNGFGSSMDEMALHLVMAKEMFSLFDRKKEQEKAHETRPKEINTHHLFIEEIYAHVPKATFGTSMSSES